MESPEQLPPIEDPKPKKALLEYWSISENIAGKIGKIGGLFLILITFVLYFTKGKESQAAQEAESNIIEVQNCLTDDEIIGSIMLNENIIKGGFIELRVHNKYTQKDETKSNLIEAKDGTFKFQFCKATTEFVEFDIRLLEREDHFINKYKIDAIPNTVILTPQNE